MLELSILSGGKLDVDRGVIFPGDDSGRHVLLPVMQLVIRTSGKTILVDTGIPLAAAGDPRALQRELDIDPSWIKPVMHTEHRLDRQLSLLGLRPSDLDLVINTHFHFDHVGGNSLFAGVPIAAQESELVAGQELDGSMRLWDASGLTFKSVSGDWSPAPGVQMLLTPGHTAGHQSMLIQMKEQPWLFTFDAVYTEEHWRENKLGAVEDIGTGRESMERLREVARKERAKLIFGHDAAQWESLQTAPHAYI